jgi:D-sedoheptulose 7-phosphate isomerase
MDFLRHYLSDLRRTLDELDLAQVRRLRDALQAAYREGRQVFVCGNGGSAALASHIAVDLGKCATHPGQPRWRVFSLTDNVPWLTALANDIAYETVFVEQLKNYAGPGDLLLAISGSGNSPNVLRAVEYARELGMTTLGLTGFRGGKLAPLVDHALVVPALHMGRVEDGHLIVAHMLVYYFIEQPERP